MSKVDFVISIKYKNNTYSLNICEMFFLWEDVCFEVVRMHNKAYPKNVIEEDDTLTPSNFDLSGLPQFICSYISNDSQRWDDLFSTYYSDDFHYDLEVLEAGIDCDIDLDSIADAYQGKYNSDADFASNLYDECYGNQLEPSWLIIDWEASAREIMYDFSGSNRHYFNSNY
jgi:hypothetical protein